MKYTFFVLLFLSFLLNINLFANLKNDSLEFKTFYYLDNTNKLSLEDVKNKEFIEKNDFLNFGYLSNTLWIKFDFKSTSNKEYILSYGKYLVDYLDVYYVKNNQVVKSFKHPFSKKKDENLILSVNYNFPFQLKKNEDLSIYFKIRSFKLVNIPYIIKERINFINYSFWDFLLSIVFFSIVFTVLLSNIIIYIISSKKIVKSYIVYLFSSVLFWSSYLGFTKHFAFVKDYEHLSCFVFYTSILFSTLAFTYLFTNLLKTKYYLKKATHYLLVLTYYIFPLIILVRIILIFTDLPQIVTYVNNAIYIFNCLNILFIIYIGLKSLLRKKRKLHMLLILWLIKSSIFIIFFIDIFYTFIDLNDLFTFLQIAIIIETILMSTMLAFHINFIEGKNRRLKVLYKKYRKVSLENYKLLSVENILGIIIHQCKQPINTINSLVFNIETNYELKKLNKVLLSKKINEIEKQTQFMSQTLDYFFRNLRKNPNYQKIHICKTVQESINLLSSNIEELGIKISIHKAQNNLTFKGYRKDLIQVFLILLNNSIDAFKENPHIKNKYININISTSKNNEIIIKLTDNAGGIKIKPLDSIFEAKITHKQSTGVGLYIAKNLLENMGKKIYCTSKEETSTFEIRD